MTGPAGAAAVTPDAQVAAGGKGFKAELDGLRERMRGLGFSYDEIAAEIGRRYRLRPREAYRLAWGWSLEQAAARFNERAARQDADPDARASLTGSRLVGVRALAAQQPQALGVRAGHAGGDLRDRCAVPAGPGRP